MLLSREGEFVRIKSPTNKIGHDQELALGGAAKSVSRQQRNTHPIKSITERRCVRSVVLIAVQDLFKNYLRKDKLAMLLLLT